VLGLLNGMVREKSHSLLPGILFQAVAITILLAVAGMLY
jgi:hypothetical protein